MAALRRLASLTGFFTTLFLALLLLLVTSLQAQGSSSREEESSSSSSYVPVRSVVYRSMALPSSAARTEAVGSSTSYYEPFELCDLCRCCSATNGSSCVNTSCCYNIDCNLPGKPYGTCAFTPRTCGCGGAGAGDTTNSNCTQPS